MNRFKDVVERYNKFYNERILSNWDNLVEAFVLYYGEEFRESITDTLNSTIITWNISPTIGELYDKIITYEILYTRIEHSCEILRRLGFDIDKIECKDVELGKLYFKDDDIFIDPGKISGIKEVNTGMELDYLLQGIFGSREVFNYEYDSNILYNFYSLSYEKQKKVVEYIFGSKIITCEILKRIDSAIMYMNAIRDMKDMEVKYKDFLIVRDYMCLERFGKRVINKLFGTYDFKIVGSLNSEMSKQRFKNYLNGNYSVDSFMVMFSNYEKGEVFKIITYPIMCTEDVYFIHELNHSVTSSVLAHFDDKSFERHGICADDDNMKDEELTRFNLEEYINQASALEITHNFIEMGGNLFGDELANCSFSGVCFYNGFLPLINSFYSTYKEVLKEVRISGNGSLLFKYVDKEIFLEYLKLINGVTNRTYNEVGKISVDIGVSFASEEEIEYADNLVKKMKTDAFYDEFDSEKGEIKKTDFSKILQPKVKIYQKNSV